MRQRRGLWWKTLFTEAGMKRTQHKLDWLTIERGVMEHIRGLLAVALGSPELLKMACADLTNPETTLEQALSCVVTQSLVVTEAYGWDETPILLVRTVLPWVDYLRSGGYHPLPLLALYHFLTETAVPSNAEEIVSICARVEVEFALEQEKGFLCGYQFLQ